MPRDRGRRYRLATGIYRDKSGIAVVLPGRLASALAAAQDGQRAGFPGQTWRPYDLRHTLATVLALQGDERAVQAWLGHTSLATSGRYTLGSVSQRLQTAGSWLDRRRVAPKVAPPSPFRAIV